MTSDCVRAADPPYFLAEPFERLVLLITAWQILPPIHGNLYLQQMRVLMNICNSWPDGLRVEFRIFDERLREWGFPSWGSAWAAGLDLFACIDAPIQIEEQAAPIFISTGMALRIGDPSWCALVLARSGAGHRGLIHGNTVGVVDPDFDGPCRLSLWNRNPAGGTAAPLIVKPGDRVGQLVFTRTTRPALIEVDEFSARNARGGRGYGSSGI